MLCARAISASRNTGDIAERSCGVAGLKARSSRIVAVHGKFPFMIAVEGGVPMGQ